MSLKAIVEEVLAEHVALTSEWRDIQALTKEVKSEEPRTREERFDFLKLLTDLFGRSYGFMSKFRQHEIKEERLIFPEMSERGKESLVHRLLDDHRKIDELLEKMRRFLEDYRFEKVSAKELAEGMMKTHKEMTDIFVEHIKIEDEEFPKLK